MISFPGACPWHGLLIQMFHSGWDGQAGTKPAMHAGACQKLWLTESSLYLLLEQSVV